MSALIVLLPAPDGPTNAIKSPGAAWNEMSVKVNSSVALDSG